MKNTNSSFLASCKCKSVTKRIFGVTSALPRLKTLILTAFLMLCVSGVWADVTDAITASDLAATGTSYVDFSSVSKTSDAVYAGNSAKDGDGNIQLRSKNSNSGIVSTTSGGIVKSVTITVGSGSNTIDVYGSNTAYTAASDLYGSSAGTLVGSLTADGTITFSDDYEYVGIRSRSGALYLSKVEITWTSSSSSYTITPATNNSSWGTVSLSGKKITATPETGYRVSTSNPYSVSPSGSATVSQSGNEFTVTPTANTTITINFESIPTHTATFYSMGSVYGEAQTVAEGGNITKPGTNPTACTGYTFVGWVESPQTTETTTKPTLVSSWPQTMGSTNKSYYALYSRAEGGSGTDSYTLISNADDFEEGTYVIAALISSNYCFVNGTAGSGHIGVESTGVASSSLDSENSFPASSLPNGAKELTITADADNVGYYFIKDGTTYLYATGVKQSLEWSTTNTTESFILNFSQNSTDGCVMTGLSGSKVSKNSTTYASAIRNYASIGSYYSDVYFFKKVSSGTTYYSTSPSCTGHTISVETVDYGSAIASPTYSDKDNTITITLTAEENFRCKNVTTSPALTITKVSDCEYTFVMPDEAVTVTPVFEAIPPRTFTFVKGSGTCTTTTLTESSYGVGVTLPVATAPSGCDPEFTFAGWATASVSETTTRPSMYAANTTYNGSDLTLYAVYQQTSGSTGFTLSISSGLNTYYAAARSSGNAYLLASTNSADAASFDIVESGGNSYLCWYDGETTYYIYTGNGDNSNLSFTTNIESADYWTVSDGSSITLISHGNSRALTLNVSTNPARFAAYKTTTYDYSLTKGSSGTTTYNSNPECTCYSVDITYDANGGTLATGCSNVTGGECDRDWQLCAAPTREGYEFTGWKDQKGTLYAAEAEVYALHGSLTLTAQWRENPFTVNFDAGNGSCSKTSMTETSRGDGVKLPSATPPGECSGEWYFIGWTKTQLTGDDNTSYTLDGVANANYVPTANGETLYAVYSKLDISGDGNVVFSPYTSSNIEEGLYVLVMYQASGSFGRLKYGTLNSGRVPYTKEWTSLPSSITITSPSISDDVFQLTNADGKWLLFNMGQETYLGAGSKGNLTWSARTSALTYTVSKNSSNCRQFAFDTYYLGVNKSNDYIRNYASSTLTDTYGIYLFKGDVGTTYYSCSPQCNPCVDPEWKFRDGEHVVRTKGSSNYTNIVDKKHESIGAVIYKSSNEAVATVNASSGEVTIVNVGSTVITLKLAKTSTHCAQVLQYELEVKDPTIEVVEVGKTTDPNNPSDPTEYYGPIIEHDLEGDTKIVIKEPETVMEGEFAKDIFISKYFEAASNMKLFAVFNGTDHPVDFSKIRVRSNCSQNGNTVWASQKGDLGYIELKDISKLCDDYPDMKIPAGTELIFWSSNKGGQASIVMNCITMTIDDVVYDYNAMEAGEIPNWYCLGRYDIYGYDTKNQTLLPDEDGNNQFVFNGDDSIILERDSSETDTPDWKPIDLFGAGTGAAPASVQTLKSNGEIKKVTTEYTINGKEQALNDGDGFYAKCDEITIPYSTNRYMLIRKKTVKDGSDAVKKNKTSFTTLCSEWDGTPVGGDTDGSASPNPYCYSGSCFSTIAQYDYAKEYTNWVTVDEESLSAVDNGDGTETIIVKDMVDRACTTLKIVVADATDPTKELAETEFKVPIIVDATNVKTSDNLFSEQHDACASCDVIVMKGAVLTKDADDATNDMKQIRNLDVYAGGKVIIPASTNYTINNLTLRSRVAEDGKNMEVPEMVVNGNVNHKPHGMEQRIRVDENRFYNFAVPYPVRKSNITFSNGEPAVYGEDYIIDVYDGKTRAENQTAGNWVHFEGEILHPGVGYMLAVAPKSGHTYADLVLPLQDGDLSAGEPATKELNVNAWGSSTTRANHKGWNLIANPYLGTYGKNNIYTDAESMLTTGKLIPDDENPGYYKNDGSSIPYVTIINGARNDYTQNEVADEELKPLTTFFVQVGKPETASGTVVKLTFDKDHRKANAAPSYRRTASQTSVTRMGLLLTGESAKDNFGVVIGEQYGPQYDMQADLSKEFGSAYSLKVYTLQDEDNMRLAYQAVHPDRLAQAIPVGVRLPATGEYTFVLNPRYNLAAFEHVWLTDNTTGKHVDLMDGTTYSFAGDKSQIENRFYLTLVLRPKTPTDLDHFVSGIFVSGRQGSMMLSGLPKTADIYIYDMAGRLVHSDHVENASTMTYPVSTGVYQVRVVADGNNALLRTIVY